MSTIDPLLRTIHRVIESNLKYIHVEMYEGKKSFQLIKHLTGKKKSFATDYNCEKTDPWYGYETITISGKNGFIRVALTPLFQVID